jgi:hypothetical protein
VNFCEAIESLVVFEVFELVLSILMADGRNLGLVECFVAVGVSVAWMASIGPKKDTETSN